MVTLAGPLAANILLTGTPLAFTLFDGVQTITNLTTLLLVFPFNTGPIGQITEWVVSLLRYGAYTHRHALHFFRQGGDTA